MDFWKYRVHGWWMDERTFHIRMSSPATIMQKQTRVPQWSEWWTRDRKGRWSWLANTGRNMQRKVPRRPLDNNKTTMHVDWIWRCRLPATVPQKVSIRGNGDKTFDDLAPTKQQRASLPYRACGAEDLESMEIMDNGRHNTRRRWQRIDHIRPQRLASTRLKSVKLTAHCIKSFQVALNLSFRHLKHRSSLLEATRRGVCVAHWEDLMNAQKEVCTNASYYQRGYRSQAHKHPVLPTSSNKEMHNGHSATEA